MLKAAAATPEDDAVRVVYDREVCAVADSVPEKDDQQMLESLTVTGRFFNYWLRRLVTMLSFSLFNYPTICQISVVQFLQHFKATTCICSIVHPH